MELSPREQGFTVGRPLNVTRRPGYDNQPAFLPASEALLYSSIGDDGQADIWRYDLAVARSTQLTHTPQNEYSPTALPEGDGFSAVRVEDDGRQRLWRFDARGEPVGPVAERIAPVGYHAWVSGTTVALFILGAGDEPPRLVIVDLRDGSVRTAAENIGRCLARIPGRRSISFVDMGSDEEWWIRELDVESLATSPLIRTQPDCEDYAWAADGTLLMPCHSALYGWRPGSAEGWRRIADLEREGLVGLTRIAASPDGRWLAIVADSN